MQNPMQMIQMYNQFRQNIKGDPKQQVQQLLNSGQMTQQQYNQITQEASVFQQMLKQFNM